MNANGCCVGVGRGEGNTPVVLQRRQSMGLDEDAMLSVHQAGGGDECSINEWQPRVTQIQPDS